MSATSPESEPEAPLAAGDVVNPDAVMAALRDEASDDEDAAPAPAGPADDASDAEEEEEEEEGAAAGGEEPPAALVGGTEYEVVSESESDIEDDITALHRRRLMTAMSKADAAPAQAGGDEDYFSSDDDDDFKRMAIAAKARPRSDEVAKESPSAAAAAPAPAASRAPPASVPVQPSEALADFGGGRAARSVSVVPAPGDLQYRCVKFNKFGMRQPRMLLIDTRQGAIRFSNLQGRAKSEFPFTEIAELQQAAVGAADWDRRRIVIVFRNKRAYHIKFKTTTDVEDFMAAARPLLAHANFVVAARGGIGAKNRSASSASSLSRSANAADPAVRSESRDSVASRRSASGARGPGSPSPAAAGGETAQEAAAAAGAALAAELEEEGEEGPGGGGGEEDGAAAAAAGGEEDGGAGVSGAAAGVAGVSLGDDASDSDDSDAGGDGSELERHRADVAATPSAFDVAATGVEEYLDYHVTKKNKYNMKQERILVLNPVRRRMTVLDADRKFRKEIDVDSMVQVDMPRKTRSGKCRLFIVFAPPQRPYTLYFRDEFDRLHFWERLATLNNEIIFKDEGEDGVASETLRFSVLKVTRVAKKKRIVYLDSGKGTIRSLDVRSAAKEVLIDRSSGRLRGIEKSLDDRRQLTLRFSDRTDWSFVFSDAAARERFAHRLRCIARGAALQGPERAPSVGGRLAAPEGAAAAAASASAAGGGAAPIDEDSEAAFAASDEAGLVATRAVSRSVLATGLGFGAPVSVYTTTYNVGESAPPDEAGMAEWLPRAAHGLYVIGLQECNRRDQWVGAITHHLGASGTGAGGYVVVVEAHLWKIQLLLVARREHLPRITCVQTGTVATGVGDVMGNKGAVGASLRFEETSLCFVVSHMQARAERVAQRREDMRKTVRALRLGRSDSDVLNQFDHMVWLGDLNYRLELEFDDAVRMAADGRLDEMQAADQLRREMDADSVFLGFREGALNFLPSYRLQRDSSGWSNKRGQPPSWTDRVLYRSLGSARGEEELALTEYSARPAVLGSDHRPVVAAFSLAPRLGHLLGMQRECQQCEVVLSNLYLESSADCEVAYPELRLLVSADFLEADVEGDLVRFASNETSWMWPNSVRFTPYMADPEFLRRLHVRLTVMDEDRHVFGRTTLPMHNALLPTRVGLRAGGPRLKGSCKRQHFRCKVTKDGIKVGVLTGDVMADYRVKRGSTMTLAGRNSVIHELPPN